MTYEIEKNVPLAPSRSRESRKKYPLGEMTVGDSFFAPRGDSALPAHRNRVASAACKRGVRHGGKFATRREGDGVRVTRVE